MRTVKLIKFTLQTFFFSPSYPFLAYDNAHFFTKGSDLRYFITSSAIKNQIEQLDAFIYKS